MNFTKTRVKNLEFEFIANLAGLNLEKRQRYEKQVESVGASIFKQNMENENGMNIEKVKKVLPRLEKELRNTAKANTENKNKLNTEKVPTVLPYTKKHLDDISENIQTA